MDALRGVIPAAIVLVMAGGFFGVMFARMVWAEDLKQARILADMRGQTVIIHDGAEQSIRDTIASLQHTIELQRQTIEILERK